MEGFQRAVVVWTMQHKYQYKRAVEEQSMRNKTDWLAFLRIVKTKPNTLEILLSLLYLAICNAEREP
jgi:hypothetical protein